MSESSQRIRHLRTLVCEIEEILAGYERKELLSKGASHAFGTRVSWPMAGKMLRVADERDHVVLSQKVQGLHEELNKLEADVQDDIDEALDEDRPPEKTSL